MTLSSRDMCLLRKLAAEERPPSMVGTVAKGLAGFGAGGAVGFGLGHLASSVYEKTYGHPIPKELLGAAGGLLGAGMSVAYALYKSKELEELQHAFETKRNRTGRGIPGK